MSRSRINPPAEVPKASAAAQYDFQQEVLKKVKRKLERGAAKSEFSDRLEAAAMAAAAEEIARAEAIAADPGLCHAHHHHHNKHKKDKHKHDDKHKHKHKHKKSKGKERKHTKKSKSHHQSSSSDTSVDYSSSASLRTAKRSKLVKATADDRSGPQSDKEFKQ